MAIITYETTLTTQWLVRKNSKRDLQRLCEKYWIEAGDQRTKFDMAWDLKAAILKYGWEPYHGEPLGKDVLFKEALEEIREIYKKVTTDPFSDMKNVCDCLDEIDRKAQLILEKFE